MNKLKIPDSRFSEGVRYLASSESSDKIRNSIKESSIFNLKSLMRSNGFSFMELMVVVAIIAILIIASMPLFRTFTRGSNIKDGAIMVMSALKKTREAAITYRKNYRTVLDTVNQAVGIYVSGDDVNPAENWKKLPEFVKFDTTGTGANTWYTGSNGGQYEYKYLTEEIYWIEFKPGGSSNSGIYEQRVLLVEESTGDTKLIRVNALTGRIRIE